MRIEFAPSPFLYAAALGEEAGIAYAIELLAQEVDRNIALLGCNDLGELALRLK